MSLVIDGYNLMHAAGIIGRGVGPGSLARSRLAVLNFVAESVEPAELPGTTVVFDARSAPPGLPRELSHRGLSVRFASGYESADELIEELIQRDSAPRRLTVVSSDHRLHRAARRRKAQAIDSDRWYAQMIEQRKARRRPAAVQKPYAAPTAGEVEYWLSRFTDEPAEKPADAADGIFPKEYLDSIGEDDT
ncbi:MAG: NYN domain-containing protein [Planctomycetia bacterium]|nr:NYN domain-containing protein [Planctomycetia bacterium]